MGEGNMPDSSGTTATAESLPTRDEVRTQIRSHFVSFLAAGHNPIELSLDGDLWRAIFIAVFGCEPTSHTDSRWDRLLHSTYGGLALAKEFRDELSGRVQEESAVHQQLPEPSGAAA